MRNSLSKIPGWINNRLVFHSHSNPMPRLHVPEDLHWTLELGKLIPYPGLCTAFSSSWKVISLVFARLASCFPSWALALGGYFLRKAFPLYLKGHTSFPGVIPSCLIFLISWTTVWTYLLCSFSHAHNHHNYVSSLRLGILFLSFCSPIPSPG